MDFAEKLGLLIHRKGESLLGLSRDGIGVSDTTLKRYLEGRSPRLEDLVSLARYFKVSVAYLADDTIKSPEDVGGVESLPESERSLIKNARILGVEDAGMMLRIIQRLGVDEALSRLILRDKKVQFDRKGSHTDPVSSSGTSPSDGFRS